MRVKICGITRREDAVAAVEAGADALGFNFWPGSKRRIGPATAAAIVSGLPPSVLAVGVFVDAPRDEIEETLARVQLGAVQLHGDETPADCAGYRVPVIKALRARPDVAAVASGYGTDFILLDAEVSGSYGGTGETFPWERAARVDAARLFLAGGLTPENVADAVRRVRPYAVDVAGGVESAPGRKDPEKVREFIRNAKNA